MTTKIKCLDLELLPNEQQAKVLAHIADACGEIRRAASWFDPKIANLRDLRDAPFFQDIPGIRDVPEELLLQAFDEAVINPGKAELEELDGFSSVYPELATVDPQARQVRLVDFDADFGTFPCRKFKGSPNLIEDVYVFRDAAAKWHAKVFFEA